MEFTDDDMSIGNGAPAWPSVIVSNGRISRSEHKAVGKVAGQGKGTKEPRGSGRRASKVAQMWMTPRRKQRRRRGRDRRVGVTGSGTHHAGVRASRVMTARSSLASTAPPTLTVHKVATALANQSRLARSGRVILVCGPSQPPRLQSLHPHSIHARNPYQATAAPAGGRSVRISHGSVWGSVHGARNVQVKRQEELAKQSTAPFHPSVPRHTTVASGRKRVCPVGR